MMDPGFKRAAVLLCQHDKDGSVGFIINKPLKASIDEFIEDLPDFDAEVMYGGPVRPNSLYYIHNVGDLLEGSRKIADGTYLGGDFDKLKFLIQSGLVQSNNIRFFLGYSGWSEGQLEEEMEYKSWVVANMHSNYLFKTKFWRVWRKAMQNIGDTFSVIAQMPDEYTWN